jgi:hypothetical protein
LGKSNKPGKAKANGKGYRPDQSKLKFKALSLPTLLSAGGCFSLRIWMKINSGALALI